MGFEYRIRFRVPATYTTEALTRRLPDPKPDPTGWPAYDFKLEEYGFYFLDHGGEPATVALAFRVLITEALSHADQVTIEEV
jgi:hypothetical protein